MLSVPDPNEMKQITVDAARKREKVELANAVTKVSDLIKRRSKEGYGFVGPFHPEVKTILEESPFISWNKIAIFFRDAGYKLMMEENVVVWADDQDLKS